VKPSGVVDVKGPHADFHSRFRLENPNDLIAIKFSPNFSILAFQCSANSVEFVNFSDGSPVGRPYLARCKGRNARILGFIWTGCTHVALITDAGLELQHVQADQQQIRPLKSFMIGVCWFLHQPSNSLLLLASGPQSNLFQPFCFRESSLFKLSRFEVELVARGSPSHSNQTPLSTTNQLCERDCALVSLYGRSCLLVIRHSPTNQRDWSGAYISVYSLQKDNHFRLTHLLQLSLSGRFAANTLDDLVVVHHQTSHTSLLFDIRQTPSRVDGSVAHHRPIVPPYSIKPHSQAIPLYAASWVIYQPNVIIDARLGQLWTLQLNLLPLCRMIANETQLFDFLVSRRNSKQVLINLCKQNVWNAASDSPTNRLATMAFLFDRLNQLLKQQSDSKHSDCDQSSSDMDQKRPMIDQQDLYEGVFVRFGTPHQKLGEQFVLSVLLEYVHSLLKHQIPVQYFLYELIINVLVRNRMFFQLHQYLQYRVFSDSKPLACLLLSLYQKYPPAVQLALDMFKRLNVNEEYILDTFLTKMDLLRALRYMESNQNLDSVSARKYLEYAFNSNNEQLFFSVFRCFEQRNLRLRGSKEFATGNLRNPSCAALTSMLILSSSSSSSFGIADEQCELFVQHFNQVFGISETH
jgi:hypothetical protein